MGPERKTRVISDKEKRVIAYHEAGHAILHYMLEHAQAVHKVTIVPRGRAGGYVMSLPEDDVFLRSREEFEDYIAAAMGGRAAEEVIFNRLTTGASNDLQQATSMARSMVMQFGMSDLLGPRTFGSGSGSLFLGREMFDQRDYSEQAAEQIDDEVKRIVETAYNRAKAILVENLDKLHKLAGVLTEQETLDRPAFEELMADSASAPTSADTAPALGD